VTSPKTSILGGILSVLQMSQIDLNGLSHGSHAEIAKLIGAVAIGLLGHFAKDDNSKSAGTSTTSTTTTVSKDVMKESK